MSRIEQAQKKDKKVNTIEGTPDDDKLRGSLKKDLILGALGNDKISGKNGNDVLNGDRGNDKLNGDDGKDRLLGKAGKDTLKGGKSNDKLNGGKGKNRLDGGEGDDILKSVSKKDVLLGGVGDDVYILKTNAKITEKSDAGIDTIRAKVNFTLGNNVENLVLRGKGDLNGTGNELANTLTGNKGNNVLDGKAGADELIGGLGDDTYFVDSLDDVVIELKNGGIDTVQTTVANYDRPVNVEFLTFIGDDDFNAGGDDDDNGIGGGGGDDTIGGGGGDDSLGGNDGDDTLSGGDGNDFLDGGLGIDDLIGGLGDDTYIVDNILDTVDELVDGGTDLVQSVVDYVLSEGVENLELLGDGDLLGTGNDLINTLVGNDGDNVLDGLGEGDTLLGGLGDDTYVVDDVLDFIEEAVDSGVDLVQSIVDYALGDGLENLELLGTDDLIATGNDLINTIVGNTGNNILEGGLGDDILDGGSGDDQLIGGLGLDTLIGGDGTDTFILSDIEDAIVQDFNPLEDIIFLAEETIGTLLDIVDDLLGGLLSADAFRIVETDAIAEQGASLLNSARLIFSEESGKLFADANGIPLLGTDGLGATGGVIATVELVGNTALSNTNFVIDALT